jgi:hypothetical protein
MIPVDLFDLLYMEDGRFFATFPYFFIKMEFLSFSSISIPYLIAIDFIFLLGRILLKLPSSYSFLVF